MSAVMCNSVLLLMLHTTNVSYKYISALAFRLWTQTLIVSLFTFLCISVEAHQTAPLLCNLWTVLYYSQYLSQHALLYHMETCCGSALGFLVFRCKILLLLVWNEQISLLFSQQQIPAFFSCVCMQSVTSCRRAFKPSLKSLSCTATNAEAV